MADQTAEPRESYGRLALTVNYEEQRYAEAFRKGQPYARRLTGFRDLDDPFRGDCHEGGGWKC